MISDSLNYSQTRSKAQGVTSTRRVDRPRGQATFKPSNKITFETPTIAQSFMDLRNFYMKFTIISDGLAKFDPNAYCLFESIKIETGNGIVVDELKNANVWYGLASQLDDNYADGYDRVIGNGGDPLLPYGGMNTSTSKTFCLPFTHGLFKADKLIPLFSRYGLRFTFQLAKEEQGLLAANGTTNGDYVISDVQFCYPLVSADSDTFGSLQSGIDAYNIDYSPLSNHTISVVASSTAETHIIPARFSSVNSVCLITRRNDDATEREQMKYAHRCASRLEAIQYKIGGSSFPYQPLTRTAGADGGANQLARISSEMYLESMSAYKTINSGYYKQAGNSFLLRYASRTVNDGDLRAISGAYEFEGVAQSQPITSDVSISSDTAEQVGSFFVCVPMAAYKSPEIHRAIYSGVNTIGGDVYCELQFGTGGVPSNMVFDYYTHYSALLRMDKQTGEFDVVN